MPPPTPNPGTSSAPALRPVTPAPPATLSGYEVLKVRFTIRLQEKLDPARARRMPESLLKQTARQLAEQMIETEAVRLPKPQREKLLEEVLVDAFWVCPLEELFRDAAALEFVVVNPQVVLARRDGGWLPTNTRLRDEDHLRTAMRKLAEQGEPVGDGLSDAAIDCLLPNGFRMVAVIPPPGLDFTPTATFVRVGDPPAPAKPAATTGSNVPGFRAPGGTGGHTLLPPATGGSQIQRISAAPPPATGGSQPQRAAAAPPPPAPFTPPAAPPADAGSDPKLTRLRDRITERIIGRLSELGVFDLSHLDVRELQKVVSAYAAEYCNTEKVFLTPSEQSRLILEIITTMRR